MGLTRELSKSLILFLFLLTVIGLVVGGWSRPVFAQDEGSEEKIKDQIGWHVVKAGETLQSITESYLGSHQLWPDNHKLNPEIRDPDSLWPGQRIRVILERQIPARNAEIMEVSNEVDKSKSRVGGWEDAALGDALEPRDGVRTLKNSSTLLAFDDGSNLILNELSQVFLKRMETSVTGVKKGEIEVVEGQIDLKLRAPRPDKTQYEIVLGETISRPKAGSTGTAETRSRLDGGVSQLMVFGGSSAVEAGGQVVEVPKGMGTSVEEGKAPKPPEKLLPAPQTAEPVRGSRWAYANPNFTWRPVAGAESYTVQVCLDRECGALIDQASNLTETRWRPRALPSGDFVWRVYAVSPSGLDGYSSKTVPFTVLNDRADLNPPWIAVAIVGQGEVLSPDQVILGAGGALRLDVIDDAAGVDRVRYRWADGPWQPYAEQDLTPPAGIERLEIESRDRLGRERQLVLTLGSARGTLAAPTVERDATN